MSGDGRVRWLVDDRPMTSWTRLYVRAMWWRCDKRAFEGERGTLERARRRQRSGSSGPTLLTRLVTRSRWEPAGPVPGWRTRPRRREPVARVVHLHGGGYVHPLTADYWRLVRALAGAPAEVVVPDYPLAPEATVDRVLPALVSLARAASADDLPVVLTGDSAGGALALSIAAMMRDEGSKPPVGVVALSPWLDATLGQAEVTDLEPSDPMLAESGLRAAGRWWAGAWCSPDDPAVSPLNMNLAGLPPLDVFIGDRDILRPAVDRFAGRAERAGARLVVHEVPAMFHVWMTRWIPEGRRTRRELRDLVRRRAAQAGYSGA